VKTTKGFTFKTPELISGGLEYVLMFDPDENYRAQKKEPV
jgi:hypothetical protein